MGEQILITMIITAIACALLGCFLVLRKLSMVTDALSHSILLGIVIAYFVTKDLGSPFLIIGAGIFGVFTVYSIELVANTGLVKNDDAVGIIFPLYFSLGVILISMFASNVHLDTDIVLMGQTIMIPLYTTEFLGIVLPKSLLNMSIILLINVIFILLFYKELKVSTFDPQQATLSGFKSTFLFYCLMALSSFTAVSAFDTVGAILVISLFIAPSASAYLITKDLKYMLIVASLYATVNSIIGYYVAVALNVSISGMVAVISGLTCFLTVLFYENGVVTSLLRLRRNRRQLKLDLVIVHIGNHLGQESEQLELGFDSIANHLSWKQERSSKTLKRLIKENYIVAEQVKKIFILTEKGQERYDLLKTQYGL
ncbi:MAG: metal ABC transporter permease [Clostridiaceae bacterium]|nr:metal ABC transporter permease [Clostridiaceae bacterium]